LTIDKFWENYVFMYNNYNTLLLGERTCISICNDAQLKEPDDPAPFDDAPFMKTTEVSQFKSCGETTNTRLQRKDVHFHKW
jgi:hypothetical protein